MAKTLSQTFLSLVPTVRGVFANSVLQAANALAEKKDREVAYIVNELVRRIVYRTPVGAPDGIMPAWAMSPTSVSGEPWKQPAKAGYKEGQLRGSWVVSFNTPIVGYSNINKTGGNVMANVMAITKLNGAADGSYWITNSTPYAARVEYDGWSWSHAPSGFMRISIAEFGAIAAKAGRVVSTNERAK